MSDFGFQEMQSIQKQLQEKYKQKWTPNTPESGNDKLLWLLAELGEVIQVIKKDGNQSIMSDDSVRTHFIEELCDVMMYFNDVLLCYNISVEELRQIYLEKHQLNMSRW